MAYIKNNTYEIGDWVLTTRVHESMVGKFTKGSLVKITDIDQIRGYTIEDEDGNRVCEIGWII